ncbi:MAG: hypothetical protein Q9191_001007 [Dirinaria sp. TL-2023a]
MVQSALFGQPPATQNDFWIVKGILFQEGVVDADPAKGLPALQAVPRPNHENKSGSIVVGLALSIFFVVFITATRIIARKTMSSASLGWDDTLIVVAAVAAVVYFSLLSALLTNGSAPVLYVVSGFSKFSTIFFNVRLTGVTSKTWILVHRALFVLVFVYFMLAMFWNTVACTPPASIESLIVTGKSAPNVKCAKYHYPVGYTIAILHSVFDYLLLAVPIIVLIQLKMSWQKKARCIIPLAVGALSGAGACVRVYSTSHPPKDPTFTVTSLPAVYNLLTSYLPHTISEHWTTRDSRSAANYLSGTKSNIGKSKGSTVDEDKRNITVRRDIDLESMRTENSENLDPGYLELHDMQRSNRCYVSA